MRKPRRNIIEEIMNEPIRMPGFPALIVTRSDAYFWFKRNGWNVDQRTQQGQSVDRMVMLAKETDQPLSEPEWRDEMLALLAAKVACEVAHDGGYRG